MALNRFSCLRAMLKLTLRPAFFLVVFITGDLRMMGDSRQQGKTIFEQLEADGVPKLEPKIENVHISSW